MQKQEESRKILVKREIDEDTIANGIQSAAISLYLKLLSEGYSEADSANRVVAVLGKITQGFKEVSNEGPR